MKDRRSNLRFTADILDMHGKSSYSNNVRILDMSVSGIALKTLRNLEAGSECILQIKMYPPDKGERENICRRSCRYLVFTRWNCKDTERQSSACI